MGFDSIFKYLLIFNIISEVVANDADLLQDICVADSSSGIINFSGFSSAGFIIKLQRYQFFLLRFLQELR